MAVLRTLSEPRISPPAAPLSAGVEDQERLLRLHLGQPFAYVLPDAVLIVLPGREVQISGYSSSGLRPMCRGRRGRGKDVGGFGGGGISSKAEAMWSASPSHQQWWRAFHTGEKVLPTTFMALANSVASLTAYFSQYFGIRYLSTPMASTYMRGRSLVVTPNASTVMRNGSVEEARLRCRR